MEKSSARRKIHLLLTGACALGLTSCATLRGGTPIDEVPAEYAGDPVAEMAWRIRTGRMPASSESGVDSTLPGDPVATQEPFRRPAEDSEIAAFQREQIERARRERNIVYGMPAPVVTQAWGEPNAVEYSGAVGSGNERWIYPESLMLGSGLKRVRRVYLENGIVVGWETLESD